uniref:C2H2-type domain-containing protein n=1 Tax=Neolamprologus brichardi TaxID=32507 RepID=A0A3Q4GRJ1_NEOBR
HSHPGPFHFRKSHDRVEIVLNPVITCKNSGKGFTSTLKCHEVIHSGIKKHLCDQCGSSFTTTGHLKTNKQTNVCTGEKPYKCRHCDKNVSSLRRHEKIHKGLKPFACIFCSKTFRQATQLKTHLRIHTGEKPFNCADCDKCFAQKCQLHSGEKPYVCDICGQAFAQSSTLTYHKRRHTGEKPYQCDLCGMSFSVSSSLIAHTRKHTGERRANERTRCSGFLPH